MPSTHIHVRIDEDIKTQAQDIFNDMGMDINVAFFLYATVILMMAL